MICEKICCFNGCMVISNLVISLVPYPELPIWPKNPYRKLGWGTLCYIYFVTASTTRLLWGYCTVKYNTFEIILEKREFSCIKKTCMHVATREFKYTLTYFLVLTTFPSSISHSFLHNLETYSYYSAMWETEHTYIHRHVYVKVFHLQWMVRII